MTPGRDASSAEGASAECDQNTPQTVERTLGDHVGCPCTLTGEHLWHVCAHNRVWRLATTAEAVTWAEIFNPPTPSASPDAVRVHWAGPMADISRGRCGPQCPDGAACPLAEDDPEAHR